MNWRAYFRLVRWRHVWFDLGCMLPGAIVWGLAIPALRQAGLGANPIRTLGEAVVHAKLHAAGVPAFAVMAIFVPSTLGLAFKGIVSTPLQWWFTLMLPGARRNLLRCHAAAIGLAAIGCVAIGHTLDSATPVQALVGITVAVLALQQLVPPRRWLKSSQLLLLGLALPLVWFAAELRAGAQAFPTSVFFAGAAVAVLAFRVGFSPRTLRANMTEPVVFFREGVLPGRTTLNSMKQEAWRTRKTPGRAWRHGAVGDSTIAWLRVQLHERYGAISRIRLWFLGPLLGAYAVGAGLFTAVLFAQLHAKHGTGLATTVFYLLCEPAKAGDDGLNLFVAAIVVMMIPPCLKIFGAFSRGGRFHTISRTRLAKVAYLSSLLHHIFFLAIISATTLLTAWTAARIAGLPFFGPPREGNLLLFLLGILPALPLLQWLGFNLELRSKMHSIGLLIVGLGAAGATGYLVSAQPAEFFSWRWLPLFALAVGAGQFAFYALVRRYYRRSDLIGAEAAAM